MHLLIMGLGSRFRLPVSSFPLRFNAWLLSFRQKNYNRKTALNEEIAVYEWQQKVKRVMKELNSR